jgi:hypothetical protein
MHDDQQPSPSDWESGAKHHVSRVELSFSDRRALVSSFKTGRRGERLGQLAVGRRTICQVAARRLG